MKAKFGKRFGRAALRKRKGGKRARRLRRRSGSRRHLTKQKTAVRSRMRRSLRRVRTASGGSGTFAGAFEAGVRAGKSLSDSESSWICLQRLWARWALPQMGGSVPWEAYVAASIRFLSGARTVRSWATRRSLMLPTGKSAAAVVTADRDTPALAGLLDQLERLPLADIVVVADPGAGHCFETARFHSSRPIVVQYEEPLGSDAGRAVGAKAVPADMLLFLSGETIIPAEKLLPFFYAVERGADLALNDQSPFQPVFGDRDSVSVVKEFVNRSFERSDLGVNSLAVLPHALSRKALDAIGADNLNVPAKAQALALHEGLHVVSAASIKADQTSPGSQEERMVGDHLEALGMMMNLRGSRFGFKDSMRRRSFAGGKTKR